MHTIRRCEVAHPHETYTNLLPGDGFTTYLHRVDYPPLKPGQPQAAVTCTEPLERHGTHHRGLGEYLTLVRWLA